MEVASETKTALMEPIPSVSSASPTIMENVKYGNAGKKPAWNRLSNGDSVINKPVMGASSWPSLPETTTKSAPCWNKSSSDSLTSLGDGSSSSSVPYSQQSVVLAELFLEGIKRKIDHRLIEQQTVNVSSAFTNGKVGQPSGQTKFPLPGHNQRSQFASQSQNHHQQNSQMNQNGNNHPRQSHGVRRNHEHVNQNWSVHRNSNGPGGFAQPPRVSSGFVRPRPPPPPPPMPQFYAQYMPIHQPFYPMVFHEFAPPMMYHPHLIPFIEPPAPAPIENSQEAPLKTNQEAPLETKILNQVHYYLSVENLSTDEFLRKRMNDEGFVHIQFIASFNKLKALTDNTQLILDVLRRSDVVELKGYEIRNRHMWKRFLMPHHLRVPFYPSPEYEQ